MLDKRRLGRRGLPQYRGPVPELPEVEALVEDLSRRLDGRAIVRVDIAAFSCLKTYDPPSPPWPEAWSTASAGTASSSTSTSPAPTSCCTSPGPAGCAGRTRCRRFLPGRTASHRWPRGSCSDNGAGLDITEAGTRKSLALYVVRDPAEVEGIARLGPDPLADDFTIDVLGEILQRGRPGPDQGRAPPPEQHRRHRQRLLRRAAARGEDVAVQAVQQPRRHRAETLYDAIRTVLGDAVIRSAGLAASELKGEKKSHMAVHGRTGEKCPVCGDTVREVSFADSSLQYCPTCQTGGKPLADRRMSRLLK